MRRCAVQMAFICHPSPTAYSPPPTHRRAALGLHSPSPSVCTGGRAGGRAYADIITKISRIDRLPKFLTHGAPLARFACRSSACRSSANSISVLRCFNWFNVDQSKKAIYIQMCPKIGWRLMVSRVFSVT